ncbi:MAG: ATP-binding protein [Myxococcota bacterium]
MAAKPFIGRRQELAKLRALHRQASPRLVVVRGRRRIGKSCLITQFATHMPQHTFWSFAGLAPQGDMTAQSQRDHFARQLAASLRQPPFTVQDWSDAFAHLSRHIKPGDVILFDEISWMAHQDPSFIPKLKAWWDRQKTAVVVVLCGSVSTWIERNILNNTAFFGRMNMTLTLQPLSITDSARLLAAVGFQGSVYDTYRLLSLMGGVPWYLEQVGAGVTADEVIKQLCFEKDGLLVAEFDRIFHDLFNGKAATYRKILNALKNGMKTLAQVRSGIGFAHSGTLSRLMQQLIVAGFVTQQRLWSFATAKPGKQSLYRICDPYMRFYLKVIEVHRAQIEQGAFADVAVSRLPGFEAHMGLQLEYLLLQNRPLLLQAMGICPSDVVCDGPYRQAATSSRHGCQIDYLVQTTANNLFICEFKFKRREIGMEIVDSMQEKIATLKIPRRYAAIPVLFHIGGVTSTVATDRFFYRIIDIAQLL